MVQFILDIKKCDEIDRIDVVTYVYMKVSHAMYTDVTHL
jgi:hypothetical protein